ncbi:response regulator [Clostridium colicanis]|uniref:Stage 0 sporulation protein A homolog n=1 Tax=Clostridium colicanis DSM 13634 TaxID=1121305 RepID=A0A151AKN0_9CLOT|nr:response regulator [Clostridium colicanis]KYH28181.1 chemotaxis protein CheY [Clostridium colicanis DSM 13634]
MIRLLIADDESLERRAVKNIILKKYNAQVEFFEAKNGREAIEIFDRVKPDIVIMDVKMPGINGIEAIKQISKISRDVYFMILTAYDYFSFAKEALEYNVKEYILKPFDKNELINKVSNAINIVEQKREERKKELEIQEKINMILPILDNEMSYAIINNSLNVIDYNTYLKYLGLKFYCGYCMLIKVKEKYNYVHLDEKSKQKLKVKIREFIKEYISREYNSISCLTPNNIAFFIEINDNQDDYQVRIDSITLGRRIRQAVKEKFGVSLSIGIGRRYYDIKNLHMSYKEAYTSLNYNSNEVNVRSYQDIYAASDKAQNNPNKKVDFIKSDKEESSREDRETLLSRIEKYININYNKELSLESLASHFNLSPYYFSRMFKELTGTNYSEYITNIRICKAKEMLKEGTLNIKEICYKVGYNDPNYFSRVFKKIEGMSPKSFKSNL